MAAEQAKAGGQDDLVLVETRPDWTRWVPPLGAPPGVEDYQVRGLSGAYLQLNGRLVESGLQLSRLDFNFSPKPT